MSIETPNDFTAMLTPRYPVLKNSSSETVEISDLESFATEVIEVGARNKKILEIFSIFGTDNYLSTVLTDVIKLYNIIKPFPFKYNSISDKDYTTVIKIMDSYADMDQDSRKFLLKVYSIVLLKKIEKVNRCRNYQGLMIGIDASKKLISMLGSM